MNGYGSIYFNGQEEFVHRGIAGVFGEEHGMARLSEDDVAEIRRLVSAGTKQRDVAKVFAISETHVSSIKFRRTWKHLA